MTHPNQDVFHGLHMTTLPCRVIDTDTHTAQRIEKLVKQML